MEMEKKTSKFEEDIRIVEQLPNDQNALDTMKTRFEQTHDGSLTISIQHVIYI